MATLAETIAADAAQLQAQFTADRAAYQKTLRMTPNRVLVALLARLTAAMAPDARDLWYTSLLTGLNGDLLALRSPEPLLWAVLERCLTPAVAAQCALSIIWGLKEGEKRGQEPGDGPGRDATRTKSTSVRGEG